MVAQGTVRSSWRADWTEPFRFTPDANPYVGHRLTVQQDDGRVACDCGASYEHVVDLERHQHAYRHPGITPRYEPAEDEEPRCSGAEEYDHMRRERRQ